MTATCDLFATCPKGVEGLLAAELAELGGRGVKETVAGVSFRGTLRDAYRACMWSRLATRVLVSLGQFDCDGPDALYEGTRALRWEDHLRPETTFSVTFSGRATGIRSSLFGAQRVKDAIVDACRARYGTRPDVDRERPDLRIAVRVHHGRALVSLNLAGESLHRRGYRLASGEAPLKENLAAAIVLRAGWPARHDPRLVDPMCGSGTVLVEAAELALGLPPGRGRRRWGFEAWPGHSPAGWAEVAEEAAERTREVLAAPDPGPAVYGYDASVAAIEGARRNVAARGLEPYVALERRALGDVALPPGGGLLLTNPPYGERIGDVPALLPLYEQLGALLAAADGWRAGVLTANPELGRRLGHAVGRRSARQYRLWNGALAVRLLVYEAPRESAPGPARHTDRLSSGARMFANRVAKRDRQLRRWARREGVSCYRIYDADLPEYAVAVDRYRDWVHVAEYAPPASIDPALAERRLTEVVLALPGVLEVPSDRIVLKRRERQRGAAQYQHRGRSGAFIEVEEGLARLLVNLRDYLDTGLFLDHRPLRRRLATLARGRRLLNLFCYTGAATVHAALGGARASVSVDLSATYLEWARRNFRLNRIDERAHRLERADCLAWLRAGRERFDVILLDPPTFSNSKRAADTLDVQRDHRALIEAARARLAPDGVLIFSVNRRRFVLDPELAASFSVEDVTRWSIDPDFARTRRPHRCWFLRPREPAPGPVPSDRTPDGGASARPGQRAGGKGAADSSRTPSPGAARAMHARRARR